MKLSKTQEKVMKALYQNDAHDEGEMCLRYNFFEKEFDLPRSTIKRAMTGLRKCQTPIVELVPTIDYETGMPNGSGFKLTANGSRYCEREFDIEY